jgi:hypothetical protein
MVPMKAGATQIRTVGKKDSHIPLIGRCYFEYVLLKMGAVNFGREKIAGPCVMALGYESVAYPPRIFATYKHVHLFGLV